jgi:NAD(P)H-nitrite reductase large subunit
LYLEEYMATRHVIIGGGPGGINAIETIRGYDADAAITLISSEPAYARMALPYYISNNIPIDQVLTGDDEYFSNLGVITLFGSRVTSVNTSANSITLDDGSTVAYDNLLIATGSSPQQLPIPGADGDGVHNLWTIEDAEKTVAAMGDKAEVAFIGAGFIGFIILNAMYKLGAKLTVIELENQLLPRMLDAQSASLVNTWLNEHDVNTRTGVSVQAIEHGSDGRKTLKLSDGSTTQADLVIVATGIQTNIDFLDGSGVNTNQGILVNNRCQSNIPNIYAAGDVAEGPDLSTGQQAVHAIQPTAVDHGRIAGANMAGQDVEYPGSLLMNILDVCGLQCASFGHWDSSGENTETINANRPVYRKLLWDGDKLSGAIILGPADDVAMLNDMGMIKGLIQAQTSLGAWKNHIQGNPTDIRRPYVATKTAERMLTRTTLGAPAAHRDYQHSQDSGKDRNAHEVLVSTKSA